MTRLAPAAPAHRNSRRRPALRGSALVIVLWSIALAAIITASLQISAQRQAMTGVHAIERVRARWAARAGVERTISVLSYFTENPDPEDAFRIYREMGAVAYSAEDEIAGANYSIEHFQNRQVFAGPMDEHTKLNINFAVENRELLLNIPYMNEDLVDAIIDWIDEDEEITGRGAEATFYLAGRYGYLPRNAFMRTTAELELVAGAWPEYVREEDWNLNSSFDPNEDDGDLLEPLDDSNGELNAGWSGYLTAYSVAGGLSASGLPRLYLPEATAEEVQERTGTSPAQAEALVAFGTNTNNTLSMLFMTPISYIRDDGSIADFNGPVANEALPLEAEQYEKVFGELTMDVPSFRHPGKININTAPPEVLRDVLNLDPTIADEIIYRRERSPQGFRSLIELVGISQNFTAQTLADIADVLDVRSNVFTITSTGRSDITGLEVQLVVVVDRSTLPVHILEYREQ